MIVIIGHKDFKKKMKKLVSYKEYVILNATKETDTYLSDMTNVMNMETIAPLRKIYTKPKDDIDAMMIDDDKQRRARKKYFKSKNFLDAAATIFTAFAEHNGELNIFIVLKQKASDEMARDYARALNKLLGEETLAFDWDDIEGDAKSLLRRKAKEKEVKVARKAARHIVD